MIERADELICVSLRKHTLPVRITDCEIQEISNEENLYAAVADLPDLYSSLQQNKDNRKSYPDAGQDGSNPVYRQRAC